MVPCLMATEDLTAGHVCYCRLRDPRGASAMPRALHLCHHGVEINAALLLPPPNTAAPAASGVQQSS
jgi:hypothetical protein